MSGTVSSWFSLELRITRGHHQAMGRPRRTQAGGLVCQVLNHANGRAELFADPGDYEPFWRALTDAQVEHAMRLLAYFVLPNQWHLVVWPEAELCLSRFVAWLKLTDRLPE